MTVPTKNPNVTNPEERCYYIYRHLRNDTGKPFYIGRGKHTKKATTDKRLYARAYDVTKRNRFWKNVYRKYDREVEIILDDLTYEESIKKEIEFIAIYGRSKDPKQGLCNLTDGGDGSINFKHSEQTILKLKERFIPMDAQLNQLTSRDSGGCWNWTGTITEGRPIIHYKGKGGPAKRVIYSYFNNTNLKRNEHVHNTCSNTLCVNPNHLVIHVAAKAIRDKSKLTEADVIEIKKLLHEGVTHADIAKIYGVRRLSITKIANGDRWGWVKVNGIPDVIKSEYHKGQRKPIVCVETGQIFASAKEASLEFFKTNKYLRHIRKVCNSGKYTYCRGFNFKFA